MTPDEIDDALKFENAYDSPWGIDGTRRSSGWTSGACRHVNDIAGSIDLPPSADVVRVVAGAERGDEWDGKSVVVLELTGGRWMTWESHYGPTGSGFSEDAYGGDADVWIADSLDDAMRLGLTDEGRALLGARAPQVTPVAHRAD